jgi:ubiquinone biosynthesis accessory factor UbiK
MIAKRRKPMNRPEEILQQLSEQASRLMPMADTLRQDMEARLRDLFREAFAKLNVVTREEFDAQMAVLARAEHTIQLLEERIRILEQAQHASDETAQ